MSSTGRRFASVLLVLGLTSVLYAPTWASYFDAWNDTVDLGYTHGYLVLALCVWFLWRRRSRLAQASAWPLGLVLAALLAVSLGWLLAYRASIEIGHQLLLPAILWLTVLAVFGPCAARAASFPTGYLYFAVPLWDVLTGPLQTATVAAVSYILQLLGVPIHIDGSLVSIPEGRFEIKGGCAGLHFFIVALALATCLGELRNETLWRRLWLGVIAAGFALVANWLRVSIIIMAGHLTRMQHPLITKGHYYFGWWVFVIIMSAYFILVSRMNPASAHSDNAAAGPTVFPARRAMAAALIFAVAPVWNIATAGRAPDSQLEPPALPAGSGWVSSPGWSAEEPDSWKPRFDGADVVRRLELSQDGRRIQVYWAAYASQRQGKELVTGENGVLGAQESLAEDTQHVGTMTMREQSVESASGDHALVWSVYYVDHRPTIYGLAEQLGYAVRSLRGPAPAAILALRRECRMDCEMARRDLRQVMIAMQEDRKP